MRILLVEDDPDAATVLAEGLREHAYAVDIAVDGGQALEHAAISDYDLIVLDLLLPAVNGLEVCRRLRRDGSATPILMLTARGEPDQRVQGLDAGATTRKASPCCEGSSPSRLKRTTTSNAKRSWNRSAAMRMPQARPRSNFRKVIRPNRRSSSPSGISSLALP